MVVTYRQALGKEKKKRDGDDSDDDDGLLRGEVEDYQPLTFLDTLGQFPMI